MPVVYKPERNLRMPAVVCIACMVCGAALFTLGGLGIGNRIVFQLLALLFFVGAIEITTKYIFTEYVYEISVENGAPDLIVTKIGGKRSMAVCNIGADSVICVQKRGKLRDFEEKYGKMDVRYNYYSNIKPEGSVAWIHFLHNEKRVLVAIEANDVFYAELVKGFGK